MSSLKPERSASNGNKPTVAILLGSLAHRRLAATFKGLTDHYNVLVITTKSVRASKADMEMPVQALSSPNDFLRSIPKVRNRIIWGYDQYLFGLDKIIENVDVVFSHAPVALYSYQAAKICKRLGKPLVVQEVGTVPLRDLEHWNWSYRMHVLTEADIVTAVTERSRALLLLEGVASEKIRMAPYGVDTEFFKPGEKDFDLRERMGFEQDETVLLFAGRIEWEKGIFDLIQAMKLIDADPSISRYNIRLAVTGHGVETDKLLTHIRYLNLQDVVRFTQPVPYNDMPRLYHAADIVIAPSIPARQQREQWCLVLSEAMACGIPVITTMCGGIPEVVGDCGLLAQPADALSLAEAIKSLVENPVLRNEMATKGRSRVDKLFASDVVGAKYTNILDEALLR